jgi:eukaryotic-like serine/threonine-protein kinase
MPEITPEYFAQRISDLGLADRRAVEQAMGELGVGDHTLQDIIRHMQQSGLVTTLQTDKILKGDRTGYFYGDYKIQYLIGAGTFARVFRAEKDGQVFAVKVLRKRFRDEVKEMEQFLREGRMGLKLRHPNIVSIVDVVADARNPFLVMEFVEGQTLRELVKRRGKLPADLALRLMYEVASGLAYAASLGIAHRDLKLRCRIEITQRRWPIAQTLALLTMPLWNAGPEFARMTHAVMSTLPATCSITCWQALQH